MSPIHIGHPVVCIINIRADDKLPQFFILHECYVPMLCLRFFSNFCLGIETYPNLRMSFCNVYYVNTSREFIISLLCFFNPRFSRSTFINICRRDSINIPIFVLNHLRNYKKQRMTKSSKLFSPY